MIPRLFFAVRRVDLKDPLCGADHCSVEDTVGYGARLDLPCERCRQTECLIEGGSRRNFLYMLVVPHVVSKRFVDRRLSMWSYRIEVKFSCVEISRGLQDSVCQFFP
jgi:hypothetical protein